MSQPSVSCRRSRSTTASSATRSNSARSIRRRRWARMRLGDRRRPRPAADGRDRKERQRGSRRCRRRRTAPTRRPRSADRSRSSGRAARPSALRDPSSRGARDCRSAWRRARRATAFSAAGSRSWRTVKTQWSKRSVSATMPNSLASIVPSLIQPSQFRSSIAQAAASPCVRQSKASRSPPT